MLEMNKEYTYSKICEIVGWEQKAGNSKKAQINEIESAYEFYHPINKKTHKEKKSYIFTKKNRDLVEPSKSNCGGAHNLKNIQPMVDYMLGFLDDEDLYEYHSFTTWYCDCLCLLNKEVCNLVYCGEDKIEKYCTEKSIGNPKVFCEYVSTAKSVLKNMLLEALKYMEKKSLVEYNDGYMFTYKLGKRSTGYFATDILNEIIKENEIIICNAMNEEFNLSKNLKGRQNLLLIYGDEDLLVEFNERKIDMLMENSEALQICNGVIDDSYSWGISISVDTPLQSYCREICILAADLSEEKLGSEEIDTLGKELFTIMSSKVQKRLFNKHYTNKYTGEIIYPYKNCGQDMPKIEKELYNYFYEKVIAADDFILGSTALEDAELDALFDGKTLWGEPDPIENDYSTEEILEMPTLSDRAV